MTKKIIGASKLTDLQVGHFASVNGNIVYRYKRDDNKEQYWFPPGIFVVEKHGHLPMQDAYRAYETGKDPDQHGYFCDVINLPDRKHVDQAINLLKKEVKEKHLNGLDYLENYTTLMTYIDDDEYETDNLLLNMSSGLQPKDLSAREQMLLKRRFGKEWLFKLGYQTNLEYLESKLDEKKSKANL